MIIQAIVSLSFGQYVRKVTELEIKMFETYPRFGTKL